MGEEGAISPKGTYKEVPRPSRRLGLATTKSSLTDLLFREILNTNLLYFGNKSNLIFKLYINFYIFIRSFN